MSTLIDFINSKLLNTPETSELLEEVKKLQLELKISELALNHANNILTWIGLIITFIGIFIVYIQWNNKQELTKITNEIKETSTRLEKMNTETRFNVALLKLESLTTKYEKINYLKMLEKNKDFNSIDTDILNYYLGYYTNDFYKLINFFKKELEKKPKDLNSLLNLGNYYSKIGEFELSKESFSEILKQDISNVGGLIGIGNYYYLKGEYREARKYYENALKIEKNSFALSNLGNIYFSENEYILARKCYEESYELEKSNVFAVAGIGKIYLLEKKLSIARLYLRHAIRNGALEPDNFISLAECYKNIDNDLYEFYLLESLKIQKNIDAYNRLLELYHINDLKKFKDLSRDALDFVENKLDLTTSNSQEYLILKDFKDLIEKINNTL